MMLPIHYKLGVAALCSMALLGVSSAQQQDKSAETNAAPVAGKATLGVAVAEEALIAPGWRASKLLKSDVYNDANQKIGKIDDFVVAPDGKLSVAVVEVGGFLGMGTHRVAIPVQQIAHVGPKTVLAGATKEALKALPEFKYLQ
jgi:sporulation protein YlmC with PRC-barrel domain